MALMSHICNTSYEECTETSTSLDDTFSMLPLLTHYYVAYSTASTTTSVITQAPCVDSSMLYTMCQILKTQYPSGETLDHMMSMCPDQYSKLSVLTEILCTLDVTRLRWSCLEISSATCHLLGTAACLLQRLTHPTKWMHCTGTGWYQHGSTLLPYVAKLIRFFSMSSSSHYSMELYHTCCFFLHVFLQNEKNSIESKIELIEYLHEELGDRKICSKLDTISGNSFLTTSISYLSTHVLPEYGINRLKHDADSVLCELYACQYGIHLVPEPPSHATTTVAIPSAAKALEILHVAIIMVECKVLTSQAAIYTAMHTISSVDDIANSSISTCDTSSMSSAFLLTKCTGNLSLPITPTPSSSLFSSDTISRMSLPTRYMYMLLGDHYALTNVGRRNLSFPLLAEHEAGCRIRINYYLTDLSYNPERSETWYALGEIFRELLYTLLDHVDFNADTMRSEEAFDLSKYSTIASIGYFEIVLAEDEDEASTPPLDIDNLPMYQALKNLSKNDLIAVYMTIYRHLSLRCFRMVETLVMNSSQIEKQEAFDAIEICAFLQYNALSYIRKKDLRHHVVCELALQTFEKPITAGASSVSKLMTFRCQFMKCKLYEKLRTPLPTILRQLQLTITAVHGIEVAEGIAVQPLYRMQVRKLKELLSMNIPSPHVLKILAQYTPSVDIMNGQSNWDSWTMLVLDGLSSLTAMIKKHPQFHQAKYFLVKSLSQIAEKLLTNSPSISPPLLLELTQATHISKRRQIFTSSLFSKRFSQVVGIWLDDLCSLDALLEQLYQRQRKYDSYRWKYFSYFVKILISCEDWETLSTLYSSVSSCRETYKVIGDMLVYLLHHRIDHQLSHLITSPEVQTCSCTHLLRHHYTLYLDIVEVIDRITSAPNLLHQSTCFFLWSYLEYANSQKNTSKFLFAKTEGQVGEFLQAVPLHEWRTMVSRVSSLPTLATLKMLPLPMGISREKKDDGMLRYVIACITTLCDEIFPEINGKIRNAKSKLKLTKR